MKTKHTKNLKLDYKLFDLEGRVSWINIESRGKLIAEVKGQHYGVNNNVCDANAKLFAAAPELLEALIEVKKAIEDMGFQQGNLFKESYYKAKKAINKATL